MKATWEDYWSTVGNEAWLVAKELIELSDDVRAHFAGHIRLDDDGEPELDWKAAAAAADAWPASSTQLRLLALVLSLVNPDETYEYETRHDDEGYYDVRVAKGTRLFDARDLSRMGSWADDVARILARYITTGR